METMKQKVIAAWAACAETYHCGVRIVTDPGLPGFVAVITVATITIGAAIEQPSFFYVSIHELQVGFVTLVAFCFLAGSWLFLGEKVLDSKKVWTWTGNEIPEVPAEYEYERHGEAIKVGTAAVLSTTNSARTVRWNPRPHVTHSFVTPTTPSGNSELRPRNIRSEHQSEILGPSLFAHHFQAPAHEHPRSKGLNGTPAPRNFKNTRWKHFSGNGFWEDTKREIEMRASVGAARAAIAEEENGA